jgi:hypothetical protein
MGGIGNLGLPLNLTLPDDYVWTEKFIKFGGPLVLCAKSDLAKIDENGDFTKTTSAVISIRVRENDYYDFSRKEFSFEKELKEVDEELGAKNVSVKKKMVRGIPVLTMTFEVEGRKLYTLAIAEPRSSGVIHLKYNARSAARDHDDAVWKSLVDGL